MLYALVASCYDVSVAGMHVQLNVCNVCSLVCILLSPNTVAPQSTAAPRVDEVPWYRAIWFIALIVLFAIIILFALLALCLRRRSGDRTVYVREREPLPPRTKMRSRPPSMSSLYTSSDRKAGSMIVSKTYKHEYIRIYLITEYELLQ